MQSQSLQNQLNCPACGTGLKPEQLAHGYRVVRCEGCGRYLRLASTAYRPPGESAPPPYSWESAPVSTGLHLEVLSPLPYPELYCPRCEAVNREIAGVSQRCRECNSLFEENCPACGYPFYLLDRRCPRCKADRAVAADELVANYRERYNYGLRMAQQGHWQEAVDVLAPFFEPVSNEQAHQVYLSYIAPQEQGNRAGLKAYWRAVGNLKKKTAGTRPRNTVSRVGWSLAILGLVTFPTIFFILAFQVNILILIGVIGVVVLLTTLVMLGDYLGLF